MRNQINNAGDFVGNLLANIVAAIPKVLGAILILLIGYIIAKVLCSVVKTVLSKVELDRRLHSGPNGNVLQRAVPSPTNLLAKVVYWIVFLIALSVAVGSLNVPVLTAGIAAILAYLPNVLVAVLILLVAGALSGAVAGLVSRTMGDTATGKVVATVAPVVILSVAGFMILNQLMIAPAIVVITYAAILGSAGLGLALAFGLGGRETAHRILNNAYEKGQGAKTQVREDSRVAQQRASAQMREVKRRS